MAKPPSTPVPETTVIKWLPPDERIREDALDVELVDVQAFDPLTKEPKSLLLVGANYPLTVTGTLEPIPKNKRMHYVDAKSRTQSHCIEIANVTRNAFGLYDDRSAVLWACGEGGWYNCQAAKSYRKIMKDMHEAIKLFYWVADAYDEQRVVAKGRNAGMELPEYTAQELFVKYATEKLENPDAKNEAAEFFYKHRDFLFSSMILAKERNWSKNPLSMHLSRKFPEDRAAVKDRLREPGAAPAKTESSKADTTSSPESLKRKRGRNMDAISFGSSSAAGTSKSTRRRRVAAEESVAMRKEPAGKTRRSQRATASSSEAPSEVSARTAITATPSQEQGKEDEEEGEDDEDDSDAPPAAHKGKSALRPRPSKAPKSNKRNSKPTTTEISSSEDLEHLHSSPSKKPSELSPNKRRSSASDPDDEGISMPPSSPSTPPALGPSAPETDHAFRFNHHLDPLQTNTWVCALDGCMHKVYSASQPDSQALIKQHYKAHVYDEDERVKLVRRLQAPRLPVRHLMERVRLQAAVEVGGEGLGMGMGIGAVVGPGGVVGSRVAGTRFPEMIVKRV